MEHVVSIAERRLDRSRASRGPAAFFFALGCPFSYLAAERVERTLGQLEWIPVPELPLSLASEDAFGGGCGSAEEPLALAGERASALRLPFSPPDRLGLQTRAAARAAIWAADHGAGRSFALAAGRMAFCGGFDLDDAQVLAEAADAVRLNRRAILAAAADESLDATLDATVNGLSRHGVLATPAVRVGDRWFVGLDAVSGAMHLASAGVRRTPAS